MHGCMTEYVVCNHPRADGRIAVSVVALRVHVALVGNGGGGF